MATAAVRLLCSKARDRFGITTVYLEHHPDNEASRSVARKAGFVQIGRSSRGIRYVRRLG